MKNITIFLFTLLVAFQTINAQNLKKVNQLLDQKSYKEAATLLLKEKKQSQEVLEKLGDSYFYTKDMPEAIKWYSTLMENHKKTVNPDYYYKLAQAFKSTGNYEKADEWYQLYSGKKVNSLSDLNNILNTNDFEIEKASASSAVSDFAPSFYGDKIVFSSARGDGDIYKWTNQPYLDLYVGAVDEEGEIVNVVPFSSEINSKKHESNAVFTKDGKTMYFTRNNSKNGKNKITHLKTYKAEFIDGEWRNIKELPFNGRNHSIIHPALSEDNTKLYFSSDMTGSIGGYDIYVVDINNGEFGSPKNLGDKINTTSNELFPFVTNNAVYFTSNRYENNFGGLDVYKADLNGATIENTTNLGAPINSNEDDFSFIINEENKTGYFASNRNSGLSDNIYKFEAAPDVFITGVVKDEATSTLLPNTEIKILDLTEVSSTILTVGEDATYSFKVNRGNNYQIAVNKDTYLPYTKDFAISKSSITNDIFLNKEKVEDNLDFTPLYFEFDKYDINPEFYSKLDSIVETMDKHPELIVKLSTFTDAFGSDLYNLKLSEKRAESVIKYLKTKGVKPVRIQSKAYGKTKVKIDCNEGDDCKKAAAKERRCEFELTKITN